MTGAGDRALKLTGQAPEERRRRVGSMLSAFYGIEGAQGACSSSSPAATAASAAVAPMDRQGFDAQQHFDGLVATGTVADVLKSANAVNAQVKDLDGDMNMVIYENYNKFIRATEVTTLVKTSVSELEPDMGKLETSFVQIAEHQRKVEEGVYGRAREIELLLKRQRVCKKLQVLFELPTTLQRCLDRGAYGQACEAYSTCVKFLRQYKQVNTFRAVLEDVELQMGRIRSALDSRLCSSELSSKDAVNSSLTLLDLGDEPARILRDFLIGRTAAQRACLWRCFVEEPGGDAETAVRRACDLAADTYVLELVDAVDGFGKIQECVRGDSSEAAEGRDAREELDNFVSTAVEALCQRIAELVERRRPPAQALVSCVNNIRDALRRLHSLMPRLLAKLFSSFLSRIATDATRLLFEKAAAYMVSDLIALHAECNKGATMDVLLVEVGRTETCVVHRILSAVEDCRPLLDLISSDKAACQQLVRTLEDQLEAFVATFSAGCIAHFGEEPKLNCPSLRSPPCEPLEALRGLVWCGPFALALAWLARRFEERVVAKAYSQAQAMVASAEAGADASALSDQSAAVGADLACAGEAALGHFVRVSGQRLAHFLRNAVQRRGWAEAAKAPTEPSLVVEMIFKEVQGFDAQLAKLLGDPRKTRGGANRRNFSLSKSPMELEIERQWAKKMQVFAPVPFNRSGALSGIFMVAFKALFEYAREETFTTFGLQQLQLDAELLGELARDFVEAEDAGALGSLLAEAVSSGTARCREAPTLLQASDVEALCASKRGSFRAA